METRQERLVMLDDRLLRNLLADREFVARLPFLRGAAESLRSGNGSGTPKCKPCQARRAAQQAGVDLNGLLGAIDNLPPSDKDFIRKRLNTLRVRVLYKTSLGKQVRSTW